jgi:xanthine dehydrogenase molybdopterin-binding subunit B
MNERAVIGGTDRAVIGASPRRREDACFVAGRGAYMDDLCFDGIAHAVFLRSPHTHARIIAEAVCVTSLNGPASGFRVCHAMRDDRL